jgi:hypothetical protein
MSAFCFRLSVPGAFCGIETRMPSNKSPIDMSRRAVES